MLHVTIHSMKNGVAFHLNLINNTRLGTDIPEKNYISDKWQNEKNNQ